VERDHIAELYRTWGPAIYRRCLRLLRDPEAAREKMRYHIEANVRHLSGIEPREGR